MTRKKNKYIPPYKFKKLKIGDEVVIRFMIGNAYIAGNPVMRSDDYTLYDKDTIDVCFESGPWKGKTLNLIRQQISTNGISFPVRDQYT